MENTEAKPLKDFLRLCAVARSLCGFDREGSGKVKILPPSVIELSRRIQETQEFRSLADLLFPPLRTSEESGHTIRATVDIRGRVTLAEILKRAGFYQNCLKGVSPKRLWRHVQRLTSKRTAHLQVLLLLGGCRFPVEQFKIAGCRVKRFFETELDALGPDPEVCKSFYPEEKADYGLSDFWFLTRARRFERCPSGFFDEYRALVQLGVGESVTFFPTADPFQSDNAGHGYDREHDESDWLDVYWVPLLVVALWSPELFRVPVILLSDPGVQLRKVRNYLPVLGFTENDEPQHFIDIDEAQWSNFRKFQKLIIRGLLASRERASIRSAALRFLRARFACRPDMTEDQTEGVLLNFIFSLERLVLLEGETEAITDKLRTRTAWMVGIDDEDRLRVRDFVNSAYTARSGVVHGKHKRKAPSNIDMRMLSDVCRRALSAALLLGRGMNDEFMRSLYISRANQGILGRIARKVRSLTTSV